MPEEIDIGGSFEDGWYDIPNIGQVPNGWSLYHYPPTVPNPIDPSPHSKWQPPETRVLHRSHIPPSEHEDFFSPGVDYTWKLFRGYQSIWVRTFTIKTLDIGLYTTKFLANADLVIDYENGQKVAATDPDSGLMRYYLNQPVDSFASMQPYLEPREYQFQFNVLEYGNITLGAEFQLPHPIRNNGVFTWNWRLFKLDDSPPDPPPETECRGLPRVQYKRVYHVYPDDEESRGPSYDDAGLGDLDDKTAVLHDIPPENHQEYRDWYWTWYPGTKVEFAGEGPPEPPDPTWQDHLCWQQDPEWANRQFGNDWYTTMYKHGCVIACLSSARSILGVGNPDANETLDLLPESAFKFDSALYIWGSSKRYLDIDTYDCEKNEADSWLAQGNVCLARVDPPGQATTHYVVVVDWIDGDYLCLNPWNNQVESVSERYPPPTRWLKVDEVRVPPDPPDPPTAVRRNTYGFHMQGNAPGWPENVARLKPPVKLVEEFERAITVHNLTGGESRVFCRHVDDDTGKYIGHGPTYDDAPDPRVAAAAFLNTFWPSTETPSWLAYTYAIQGLNETIATGNPRGTEKAVAFEVAFSDLVAARAQSSGLSVKAVLLSTAVGNPGHYEIDLLLPAAEAANRNGHVIGYNGYAPCTPQYAEQWTNDPREWKHHHMRSLLSWDPVFLANGYKVLHALMEFGLIGAHVKEDSSVPGWFRPASYFSAASGWRSPECLNGDWPRTLAIYLKLIESLDDWDYTHGNRLVGVSDFTMGGGEKWSNFEKTRAQRGELVEALTT